MADDTLTRRELYERIWNEPVQKLAKEFGMSDVGLAKLCRRHDIPRPPRGHWARKQHGYKTKQTPLPKGSDDQVIFRRIPAPPKPEERPDPPEVQEAVAFESSAENRIEVSAELSSLHPLAERTRKALPRGDKVGAMYRCVNVRVSEELRERAIRIVDALLKGFEARKFKIVVPPAERPQSYTPGQIYNVSVEVGGVVHDFSIIEKSRQLPNPDYNPKKTYSFSEGTPPKYIHELNGRLQLQCKALEYLTRWRWVDSRSKRLEDHLNDFMLALKIGVYERAERDRRNEEFRRQYEEEERRRIEEAQRIDDLARDAERWQQVRHMRQFIRAVSRRAGDTPDPRVQEWLDWARRRVRHQNPVRRRVNALLRVRPDAD